MVERFRRVFSTVSEDQIHPHCAEERPELFEAVEPGGPEVEALELLYACVRMVKPLSILETGTGSGLSTIALASAAHSNGFGFVETVEMDPANVARSFRNLGSFDSGLVQCVKFNTGHSLDFLAQYSGPPFELAFFDTDLKVRHEEFELLLGRGKLAPRALCLFHDTSRMRGRSMHDYNEEAIEALDRLSTRREWIEFDLSRGLRLIRMP